MCHQSLCSNCDHFCVNCKIESNCSAVENVIFVTIYYISFNERLPFFLIVTSLGPITSTLVILHLCLLKCKKCKKKQRDKKRKKVQYGPLEYTYTGAIINEIYTVNERNDVFTSYTIMLELNIVLIEAQQLLRVCLNCYHKILCFLLHKLYCMII